ncbi:DUF3043 domain-containing protein [Luteococcus sp. H138]|uniref:DUF3043 domain-containing protein n=1 Tax=unclassified Luteococcus TaxID=2639923 RepID=UPI00313CC554
MGLFRPYEQGTTEDTTQGKRKRGGATAVPRPQKSEPAQAVREQTVAQQAVETTDVTGKRQPQKKGTRTPTRAEAEAARMARLHPTLSPKEAKKAQRQAEREQRLRNLDAAENLPERRLVRDHVDSQLTITEFTIPVMLVIMAISLGFGRSYAVQTATSVLMMAVFALWVVNITLRWRSFKKLALARGLQPKQRGLMMYLINRMMTIRGLRRPEPRIKRGESY